MGYEMAAGLFCAAYLALFHLAARRPRPVAAPAGGRGGTYRR
jgi:hypothetical protein